MSFLIGLLFGTMIASGGGSHGGAAILGDIPLRCLIALEQSEENYKRCRRPSLAYTLYQQWQGSHNKYNAMGQDGGVGRMIDESLTWEIAALRKLEAEARKQAETR